LIEALQACLKEVRKLIWCAYLVSREPKVLLRHPLYIFGPSVSPAYLFLAITLLLFSTHARADTTIELNGSPFATEGAPLPSKARTYGERLIYVDPSAHAWGAYGADGKLMRWGIATAGNDWCDDTGEECKTKAGDYRIYSVGDIGCVSNKFPIPDGGAPMPYCMYFSGGQAIHGSNEVVSDNVSHGCVRVHVADAKWLRYNFVESPSAANHFRGTRVYIEPY
jgi:lipoprotein-anchoring transpeptidase ErfK/SrfK